MKVKTAGAWLLRDNWRERRRSLHFFLGSHLDPETWLVYTLRACWPQPWCPNQGDVWPQVGGLGTVWLSFHLHGSGWYVCGGHTHTTKKREEYMRASLVFRNSCFTVFTLYRPVPVCLFTPARFTLPGPPGASSGVYLVITPIHQDEHGGEVGLPDELIAGYTDQAKSQWAAGEVAAVISFQLAVPSQQRPDLPLVSQACTSCLSSQHLSGTRKDRACQKQGSVFNKHDSCKNY